MWLNYTPVCSHIAGKHTHCKHRVPWMVAHWTHTLSIQGIDAATVRDARRIALDLPRPSLLQLLCVPYASMTSLRLNVTRNEQTAAQRTAQWTAEWIAKWIAKWTAHWTTPKPDALFVLGSSLLNFLSLELTISDCEQRDLEAIRERENRCPLQIPLVAFCGSMDALR